MSLHTKHAIMTNYGLKFPTQRISLDPVRHIASIASSRSDCVIRIHKRHIFFDVFKAIFEVFVRSAAPLAIYS